MTATQGVDIIFQEADIGFSTKLQVTDHFLNLKYHFQSKMNIECERVNKIPYTLKCN